MQILYYCVNFKYASIAKIISTAHTLYLFLKAFIIKFLIKEYLAVALSVFLAPSVEKNLQ